MVWYHHEERRGGGTGRLQRGDLQSQMVMEAHAGSPIAIGSSFKDEVLHGPVEGHLPLLQVQAEPKAFEA